MINPENTVQEGYGSPQIDHIDYARVHLNRLLAEIELEQVNNVHIIYNVPKKGKYGHLFKEGTDDKGRLQKNFDARIDVKDLETAFVTVKFHSMIIDLRNDEREALLRMFDRVISNLYMSAAD